MSRGDVCDRAAEREMEIRDAALLAQREAAAADRALGDQPTRCCDCATKIPVARMQAVPGVKRCIDCQNLTDLMRKRK